MKKTRTPNGFTLVELAIVIALIGIMASIAGPAWQRYSDNTKLKTATRQILSDIYQARQRAITENIDAYQITFDYSGNTYSLSRSDTGATLWTKKLTDTGKKNVLWWAYFYDSGTTTLKFKKRGTLSQGYVFVRNTFWSYTYIYVPITGRPYVYYYLQT